MTLGAQSADPDKGAMDALLEGVNAELDADPDFAAATGTVAVAAPEVETTVASTAPEAETLEVAPEASTEAGSPLATAAPTGTTSTLYSDELFNAVKKYGGDGTGGEADKAALAKLGTEYWSGNQRMSEMAKELETLRAAAARGPEPKPAPSEAVPVYPAEVVGRFDQRMTRLADRYDDGLAGLKALDQEIATAKGTVRNADKWDTEARADAATKLLSLEDRRAGLVSSLQDLKESYESQKDLRESAVTRYELQQEISRTREAEVKGQEQQIWKAFETRWDAAIDEAAKDLPVLEGETPADTRADFKELCDDVAHRMLMVKQAKGETQGLDPKAVVAVAKQKYLGRMDRYHRAKSADYGKRKIEDSKISRPAGKSAAAPEVKRPATGVAQSREELDRRLEEIDLNE